MEELTGKEKVLLRMVLKQTIGKMREKQWSNEHFGSLDVGSPEAQAEMAEDLEKAMYKILPRDTRLFSRLLHEDDDFTIAHNLSSYSRIKREMEVPCDFTGALREELGWSREFYDKPIFEQK